MALAVDHTEGRQNLLPGEVADIGYLGNWTVYRVRLDSGPVVRVSRANAARSTEDEIGRGTRVAVAFAPEAAMILAG